MGKQKCCDGSDCVRESNSSGWNLPDNTEITTLQKQNSDSDVKKCKHDKCVFVLMRTRCRGSISLQQPSFPRTSELRCLRCESWDATVKFSVSLRWTWGDGGGLMVVQTQKTGSTVCPGGLLGGGGEWKLSVWFWHRASLAQFVKY